MVWNNRYLSFRLCNASAANIPPAPLYCRRFADLDRVPWFLPQCKPLHLLSHLTQNQIVLDGHRWPILVHKESVRFFGAGDLPIGLSFFSTAYDEGGILSLAYAYEQVSKKRTAPKFKVTVGWRNSFAQRRKGAKLQFHGILCTFAPLREKNTITAETRRYKDSLRLGIYNLASLRETLFSVSADSPVSGL